MSAFVVGPEAEDDTYNIWRYLLREAGLTTADRVETELLDAFCGLGENPRERTPAPVLTTPPRADRPGDGQARTRHRRQDRRRYQLVLAIPRSEERRVGKECRSRW